MLAVLKMWGKALLLTVFAGILVVATGIIREWDSSLQYSNGFFVAGCLVIVAGASSRMGAGPEWNMFQLLHAESFRDMSSAERANFILKVSSPVRLVILGLLSGTMLLIVSYFVAKIA